MRRDVLVRGGAILASGSFNRHLARRSRWLPGIPSGGVRRRPVPYRRRRIWRLPLVPTMAPPTTTNPADESQVLSHAFWAPVSLRTRTRRQRRDLPLMDRGKPGMITVNQRGERFVNESTSYHLFALWPCRPPTVSRPAFQHGWCVMRKLARYGLGMIRPGRKLGRASPSPTAT